MPITHEDCKDCFIIYFDEPDLTREIVDSLRQVLTIAFLSNHANIIMDFNGCKMLDSYFIGLLISTLHDLKDRGGSLKCAGIDGQVAAAFEAIRLDKVLDVYDTIYEAMDSYQSEAS